MNLQFCCSQCFSMPSRPLCYTLLFFILLCGPIIVLTNLMYFRMIVNEWYLPAFATLAVSGASDWVRITCSGIMKIH